MASKWMVAVTMGLAFGGIVGCDDDDPRAAQCRNICAKNELCDSTTDEADCVADCDEQTFLSSRYVSVWADCVVPDSVSCDFAMDAEQIDDCVTDALRTDEPSELLEDICDGLSTKLNACDDADILMTEKNCLRGDSRKLSDDYLTQSRECVDSSCDDIYECIADLADDNDTELSILSGSDDDSSSAQIDDGEDDAGAGSSSDAGAGSDAAASDAAAAVDAG